MNNADSSPSSAGLEHSRSSGNSTSDRPQRTSIIVAPRAVSSLSRVTFFANYLSCAVISVPEKHSNCT